MICTVLAIAIAPPRSVDLVSFTGFLHKSPSLRLVKGYHTSNSWIPGSSVLVDIILVGSMLLCALARDGGDGCEPLIDGRYAFPSECAPPIIPHSRQKAMSIIATLPPVRF